MLKVEICIPTYKRPVQLAKLLQSIDSMTVAQDVQLSLIVADNDANKSARDIVETFANSKAFPISYIVEPKTGVVHVRNRLLDMVTGEYIVFVDDDTYASPDWLSALLTTASTFDADAVIGAVEPIFPGHAPPWMSRHHGYRTGSAVQVESGSTTNVLLRRAFVASHNLRFDDRFNYTGGEDTDFFDRFHGLGGRIYFSPDAKIFEPVPDDRVSINWYLKRSFRVGQTNVLVHGRKVSKLKLCLSVIARLLMSIPMIVCGAVLYVFAPSFAAGTLVAGVRHLGYFCGAIGMRTEEYNKKPS